MPLTSIFGQEKTQGISFLKEVTADTVYFHLENSFYAPITFSVTPKNNFKNKVRVSEAETMKKRDTLKNVVAIPIELVKDTSNIKSSKFIKFKGNLGNKNLKSNLNYLYDLPFEKNKSYKIMQPNFGSLSHNIETSFYAIDFTMPIGTPVHAARSGTVIKTEDNYTEHGGEELKYKANTIAIFHKDGSIAHYDHLSPKGVFVKTGEYVTKGQYIGLSGFTGYTTKPHLHFVVQNGKNVSIPIYFRGYKNKVLKKRKYYKNK